MSKPMTKDAIALKELRRGPRSSMDLMVQVNTTQPERLIWTLRQKGFDILTERVPMETGRGAYAIYHLLREPGEWYEDGQEDMFTYE